MGREKVRGRVMRRRVMVEAIDGALRVENNRGGVAIVEEEMMVK